MSMWRLKQNGSSCLRCCATALPPSQWHRLAEAGNSGEHKGNTTRDVVRAAPTSWIRSCFTTLPMKSRTLDEEDVSVRVLWPHEFFAILFHKYKEHFFTYMVPSLDRLRAFWASQQGKDLILSSYYISLSRIVCSCVSVLVAL